MVCCPLCFRGHPDLSQHLQFFHKVVNTEERGIILQWASRRVDLTCMICPICSKKISEPQHHLHSEHQKLSPSEESLIDKEKFKVIVGKLRSLRADCPQPAMVTKWDLDLQASGDEVQDIETEDLSDYETQASEEEEMDIETEDLSDYETQASEEEETDINPEHPWDLENQASKEEEPDINQEHPWDLETQASKEEEPDINQEHPWDLETQVSKEEELYINLDEPWDLDIPAPEEEVLAVTTEDPNQQEESRMPFRLKGMACCPLCFRDYPDLSQHLQFFHKVVNTEERGIILQWASRRVDLTCMICPICSKKISEPQHHLHSEHQKLSPSEESLIDKEKFKVIVGRLRSLRAKCPQPAMVTKWDLDLQASGDEVQDIETEDLSDFETQFSEEEETDINQEHPWDLETQASKEEEPYIKPEEPWDLETQASKEEELDIKMEDPWDLETQASKEEEPYIKPEEPWDLEIQASEEQEPYIEKEDHRDFETQASIEEEPHIKMEDPWDLEVQASKEEEPDIKIEYPSDLEVKASKEQEPYVEKEDRRDVETQTSRGDMSTIKTDDPWDLVIQASGEEALAVTTEATNEQEGSRMPFRLTGTTCCPLCFDHYVDLSHHLWVTHKILNTTERGLILQWANRRVDLENIRCPVCSKKTKRPEHHIQFEHKEISASETISLLEGEKFKRIVQQLRSLRATRPQPPMVTKWDLEFQASRGESPADRTESRLSLRLQGLVGCPLCYGHYSALSQHLRVTHKVLNREERSLILQLVSRRVNLQYIPCPICSKKTARLERHIQEHKELTASEVTSLLEWEKFKVTVGKLRSLRASRPLLAMVTQWDLLGYEVEAVRWGRNEAPIEDERELCDNKLCQLQTQKYQETIASLNKQVAQLTSTLQEVAIQLLEVSKVSTAAVPAPIRSLLTGLQGLGIPDTGPWASPARAGTTTYQLEEGEQSNEPRACSATAAENSSAEQATVHRTLFTAAFEGGEIPVSKRQQERPTLSCKRPSESSKQVETKKSRQVDNSTLLEEPEDNEMLDCNRR